MLEVPPLITPARSILYRYGATVPSRDGLLRDPVVLKVTVLKTSTFVLRAAIVLTAADVLTVEAVWTAAACDVPDGK